MLADEITSDLRAIRAQAIATAQAKHQPVTRQLISKTISYGAITANPDGTVDISKVRGVNPDLRVRPFFADRSASRGSDPSPSPKTVFAALCQPFGSLRGARSANGIASSRRRRVDEGAVERR